MTKLPHLIVSAALAALALSGCKNGEDQPKAAAGGELLERSVADDMLPYDTVRSQASLSDPGAGLSPGPADGPAVSASAIAEDDVVSEPEPAEPVVEAPPPVPQP